MAPFLDIAVNYLTSFLYFICSCYSVSLHEMTLDLIYSDGRMQGINSCEYLFEANPVAKSDSIRFTGM